MKVKVSLAVAIIKNRPSGMSGREYAEALASKLRREDAGWKEKALGLQQEVLRLRREMLITKVTSKSCTPAADDDSRLDDMSQDLFGPGSSEETPEVLPKAPEPAAPQPPPPPSHPRRDALFSHVHFLQSLCGLQRVEGSGGGQEALWFSPDGDTAAVLGDTVCQLLDCVVAACKDPPALGPPDLVLRACQAAARASDLLCSQRLPPVEFVRRVEERERELTRMLLHTNQPSGLHAAEKLMECLIALGNSRISKSFLIRHILAEINAVADQLWQASQVQVSSGLDRFPVDQYQNSCHLFFIVEKLLQQSEVARWRLEAGSELMGLLSHLEQRVFLLSEEFPLFSIYMWRIGSLLTASDG
ncbi:meiosis-specific protein MEI4 [Odontesthes bonariensis]